MKPSEPEARALCHSLAATIGQEAGGDFKVELGCLMKRYLREHDQRVLDAEAARLIHLGADAMAARLGCCRATVYNRANRFRTKSKQAEAS